MQNCFPERFCEFLAATFFSGNTLFSVGAARFFLVEFFCKTLSERYSVLSALQDWQTKTQRKPDMLGNIIIVLSSRSPPSNVLSRFEALGEQVAAVPGVGEAIIDGEVIVVDEAGRPVFNDLLRRKQRPAMWPSTFCGWTVPICGLCRSATGDDGCKAFCRRDLPRAGGANSSS